MFTMEISFQKDKEMEKNCDQSFIYLSRQYMS